MARAAKKKKRSAHKPVMKLRPGDCKRVAEALLQQLEASHDSLRRLADAFLPIIHKSNCVELEVKFQHFSFACDELHAVILAAAGAIDDTKKR